MATPENSAANEIKLPRVLRETDEGRVVEIRLRPHDALVAEYSWRNTTLRVLSYWTNGPTEHVEIMLNASEMELLINGYKQFVSDYSEEAH